MNDTHDDSKVHLNVLPTGKKHISYSEFKTWMTCPWAHKLTYIDDLGTFDGNEHTKFGSCIHDACENYVRTRVMDIDKCVADISKMWDEGGYDDKDTWIEQAIGILNDVPSWLDNTFNGWELIDAEYELYEPLDIAGHADVNWRGFVDLAIRHKGKRGNDIIHILDWKTTSWGWSVKKRRDFLVNAQIMAYKLFWSQRFDVDLKDIRAGFILLKRTIKRGSRCQLIDVSVGPKSIDRVIKNIDIMLRNVKGNRFVKKRLDCNFCEYVDTIHCDSLGQI